MQQPAGVAHREILTSDGESRPRYRADVDGLRAIAILSVVLFHINVPGFTGGYVGVDIFFVISGFLIGGIVFRDVSAGRYSFATFYARRAKRILPALLCMTSIVAVFALFAFPSEQLSVFSQNYAAALIGCSNIRFWVLSHYFAIDWRHYPLVMTWSLGVEEQFYLFMPPLMLLLHRISPRTVIPAVVLASLLSLALSVHLARSQPSAAFYLLPGRAWELGVGVLVALWFEHRPPRMVRAIADPVSLVALAAIATSIALFNEHTRFPGFAALLPVLGTAALIVTEPSRLNRLVLAAEPMRFIGLISYSWYLWHWPPLAFARLHLGRDPNMIENALLIALSFVAACASWRFVETPFRRRTRIPNAQLLKRYGLALLAALALAGTCFAEAEFA